MRKLENEGDITPAEVKTFYLAVRGFYTHATNYALKNLPLSDDVFINAKFANFVNRDKAQFIQVEFFVQRYPKVLPFTSPSTLNELEEEFLDYQLMLTAEVPDDVWKSAIKIDEDEKKIYRMDTIWAYLSAVKNPDGTSRFSKLAKVARLVLTLPHSNAEEERVFSMVTKNKTSFRPNLKLDGTLQSILTIKLGNPEPCTRYEPAKSVVTTAKKATMEYNRAHCSGSSTTGER